MSTRRPNPRWKMGKWKWGEGWARWGLPHPIEQGYYTISVLPLNTIELNHLAQGRYGPTRCHLHQTVTDAATCRPFLLRTSAQVLRPKPVNPPPMVLRPKPPNPLASSVLHTRPPSLVTCHRHPRPAGTPRPLSLSRPARLPSWLLALVDVPSVSYRG
jgi:hypothetical protein